MDHCHAPARFFTRYLRLSSCFLPLLLLLFFSPCFFVSFPTFLFYFFTFFFFCFFSFTHCVVNFLTIRRENLLTGVMRSTWFYRCDANLSLVFSRCRSHRSASIVVSLSVVRIKNKVHVECVCEITSVRDRNYGDVWRYTAARTRSTHLLARMDAYVGIHDVRCYNSSIRTSLCTCVLLSIYIYIYMYIYICIFIFFVNYFFVR